MTYVKAVPWGLAQMNTDERLDCVIALVQELADEVDNALTDMNPVLLAQLEFPARRMRAIRNALGALRSDP